MQEPSVVAVDDNNVIVAVGEEAREMIGRTPANIQAIRPMRAGVIADYVITEALLRHFIQKVQVGRRFGWGKPEVMISVPAGVTSVEKARRARRGAQGGRGRGVPDRGADGRRDRRRGADQRPSGALIIDIGGGTSEIAVISLGAIVVSTSLRVGGNKIDDAISSYIRKKYNLMVGDRTAEEVKIQIGTALPLEHELTDGRPWPRPHRRLAANDPDDELGSHGSDRAAASADHRRRQIGPGADPAGALERHHRQGHGDVRRRIAAPEHRQAADPGHRRALPRRR